MADCSFVWAVFVREWVWTSEERLIIAVTESEETAGEVWQNL